MKWETNHFNELPAGEKYSAVIIKTLEPQNISQFSSILLQVNFEKTDWCQRFAIVYKTIAVFKTLSNIDDGPFRKNN